MSVSKDPRATHGGFTLIELMVVVAIIATLAAAAFSVSRAQKRNVQLRHAAGELAMRVLGLRSNALADGVDYLLVAVDAPGNDSSGCGTWNLSVCAQYFVLAAPLPAWRLSEFDPDHPAANVAGSGLSPAAETEYLPAGARFSLGGPFHAPPAPFDGVPVFDERFVGDCAGRSCFAIRFSLNGVAHPVRPDGTPPPHATGFAFVLATDKDTDRAGGDRRGVVVGFPSGVAKTWAY